MSMNKILEGRIEKILNLLVLIIFKIGGYENTMIWKKMVVMKSFLYGIFWSRSRSRKLLIISAPAPAKKAGSGSVTLTESDLIYAFYIYGWNVMFLKHIMVLNLL